MTDVYDRELKTKATSLITTFSPKLSGAVTECIRWIYVTAPQSCFTVVDLTAARLRQLFTHAQQAAMAFRSGEAPECVTLTISAFCISATILLMRWTGAPSSATRGLRPSTFVQTTNLAKGPLTMCAKYTFEVMVSE
jgi:hypothetical protein